MSLRLKRVIIAVICILIVIGIAVVGCLGVRQIERHAEQTDGAIADYVVLPSMYMQGMVIQRDKPLVVQGTTTANATITVTISRDGICESAATQSGPRGSFSVSIDTPPADVKPYTLSVASGTSVLKTIDNVYVGDVFLAAGQSNMEANYNDYYADAQIAAQNLGDGVTQDDLPDCIDDRNVHFWIVDCERDDDGSSSTTRGYATEGKWLLATGDNARHLSYLAQFFAEDLREHDSDVPIGIVQTAQAATEIVEHMKEGDVYQSRVACLRGYPIGGVLWYQGEQDSASELTSESYLSNFLQLIRQYRQLFADEDLPFLYAQLARYDDGGDGWSRIRQAQYEVMKIVGQNAGIAMTVTLDTDKGTSSLLHPLGKDIIASRMASQWIAIRASQKVPVGPIAITADKANGDESSVIVGFMHDTAKGLTVQSPIYDYSANANRYARETSKQLSGIEVAGPDGVFHDAHAIIRGNSLVATCEEVDDITQIRYQWGALPKTEALLYNQYGLPASPFWIQIS